MKHASVIHYPSPFSIFRVEKQNCQYFNVKLMQEMR